MTYSISRKFTWLSATTKPIGLLLLLLNVQLNICQEASYAENAFHSANGQIISEKPYSLGKHKSANLLCPAQLGAAIESVTDHPQFSRGRWGILIQTLSSSQTLYSQDAQKYFVPASNVKLLTTAAALQRLGSKFRIRTSVYGNSEGYLRVVGRGDPSLTDTELKELAQQLSRRGIRQVQRVVADDNYFRGSTVNPTWEWEDIQFDYGAPVNSLILNQNAVVLKLSPQQLGQPLRVWIDPKEATQWRIQNDSVTTPTEPTFVNVSRDLRGAMLKITGQLGVESEPETVALAVLDPSQHFLRHFRRALAAVGINENADTRRYTQILSVLVPNTSASELAAVESPPLSQLLVETNQNSNNLYAEALLRTLGASAQQLLSADYYGTPAPTNSTNERGLRVVKATLTELGVDPTGYVLADSSGLSRHNLVSPEAIAQTLRAMAKSRLAAVYRASLPVAGMSGTLRNRFQNTAAQGIVQAKTGTMSGVVALSGYLDAQGYQPLVFSIIVNQSNQPAATIRQAIDEIVLLLTRLHFC